jgi:hypothetical protein
MAEDIIRVGKPIPRIRGVKPLKARVVSVAWDDGTKSLVDLMPALASHKGFVRLRTDNRLFRTVSVGEYGGYLRWEDGSELSSVWVEELRDASLDNTEFREAMDRLQMSLDGMAARLGIARRLIAEYRKDKPIPKHIALATRYLLEQRKAG